MCPTHRPGQGINGNDKVTVQGMSSGRSEELGPIVHLPSTVYTPDILIWVMRG